MKIGMNKEKLAKKLIDLGRVSQDQVQDLLASAKVQKRSIFSILSEREIMKEEDVMDFLSENLEIPLLNLNALRIPKGLIKMIPKKIVDRYQILPLGHIGNLLTVATSDPFELMVRDDLKEVTNCSTAFVLVSPKMINTAIENYYGETSNIEEMLEGLDAESLEIVKDRHKDQEDPEKGDKEARSEADNAPVVRMVNLILSEGIRARASDVHFEPYEKEFRVRYRIDGALKESFSYPRELYTALVARIKIMATLDITEKRLPQDGRFRVSIKDKEIDFRVSILPIYHGEKIVLRVLDRSTMKSGLNNLGFSDKPVKVFAEAIERPYGMILVTGPTGSGKSTTLYTILNTMNTPNRNIMTIEDPIEYQVEGITQTQVNSDVGLTFASGLRCLLRQSPDIILVGEIRDTETADIAVKAALTGHLVFSTLHTNSAAGAMIRLTDMGVEPFLIASSVICVAAQRLMRKICEFCKVEDDVPEEALRRCGMKKQDMQGLQTYRGRGCAKCNQTGYYGRIAAVEILKVDQQIQELILKRASSDEVAKKAIENGMETLFQNAFSIFKNGLTTLDEVLRVSSHE